MNKNLSAFIDCSRWVAAFFVVLGHTAHLLVKDTGVLHFLTSQGHAAVVVFFVISGYLVGGISLAKWRKSGPDVMDYAINRFSRIYVVLVPALLLGYAIDYAGMTWLNGAGLYSNVGQLEIGSLDPVEPRLSPFILLGNLLMLEGSWTETLGSNGPLWSLAFEWWYYCLFCFVATGLMSRGWVRISCFATAIILTVLLPPAMLLWMVIWLAGTALFFVMRTARLNLPPIAGMAVFISALIVSYLTAVKNEPTLIAFVRDVGVGLAFCVLLFSFRNAKSMPLAAFHQWAAGFSYSMYLFHFPVLLALVGLANRYLGVEILAAQSLSVGALMAAVIALLYVAGFFFSLGTERHTDTVKSLFKRWSDIHQKKIYGVVPAK